LCAGSSRYTRLTRRPAATRRIQQRVVAVVLAAVAVVALVVEPLPKGFLLLSITETHGIEAGDLPAILLLFAAARLAA
jgi:hypothetical protein